MTVLDMCVEVLKWFQNNDCFDLHKDFNKIILISENPKNEKALLLASLQRLEKQEMVTSVDFEGSTLYFLNKNLQAFDQEITVDQETATKVSSVINKFCDTIDDHKDVSDPASIKSKDILHLALILETLQERQGKNGLDL